MSNPSPSQGLFSSGGFEVSIYSSSGSLLATSDANGEVAYSPGTIAYCPSFFKTYYFKVRKPGSTSLSSYLLRVDAY